MPQNLTNKPTRSEDEPSVNPASTHVAYQRWGRGDADADTEIVVRAHSRARAHEGALDLNQSSPTCDRSSRRTATGSRGAAWDGTDTSTPDLDDAGERREQARSDAAPLDADSPDWQPRL